MNQLHSLTPLFQGGIDPAITLDYLLLGYAAMWAIALLYVITLANRQRNLKQDIQLLKQLLEEDKETRAP